jgi:hypothetical protein
LGKKYIKQIRNAGYFPHFDFKFSTQKPDTFSTKNRTVSKKLHTLFLKSLASQEFLATFLSAQISYVSGPGEGKTTVDRSV